MDEPQPPNDDRPGATPPRLLRDQVAAARAAIDAEKQVTPGPPDHLPPASEQSSDVLPPAATATRDVRVAKGLRRPRRTAARIDRLNRVLFMLIGIKAIGIGSFLLLANDSNLGDLREPFDLYDQFIRSLQLRPELWWGIATAASVVAIVVMTVWMLAQFAFHGSGARAGFLILERTRRGSTSIATSALARSATRDIRRIDGVASGRIRVLEGGELTRLFARVNLVQSADVAAVQASSDEVFERVGAILGAKRVEARLRINLAQQASTRVT